MVGCCWLSRRRRGRGRRGEVVAVIADSGSGASRSLHRSAGVPDVGRLSKVGCKQDRWLGVVLVQASLTAPR